MNILDKELSMLTKLDNLRREAQQLRKAGKEALKFIEDNSQASAPHWYSSEDLVEAALLVKIQAHRHLGEAEHDAEASEVLVNKLRNVELEKHLFSDKHAEDDNRLTAANVPILAAARVMQALVATSQNAFSKASLLCYYRIVREIQSADSPNWTIGGAKAAKSGDPTAFITGECIRAILSFERTHRDTSVFFGHTYKLYEQLNKLKKLDNQKLARIQDWQDAEIERAGLAWFTSTEVRLGEIALKLDRDIPERRIDRKYLEDYFSKLSGKKPGEPSLVSRIEDARREFYSALVEIDSYRIKEILMAERAKEKDEKKGEKLLQRLDRSESAHRLARSVVVQAIDEADNALNYCTGGEQTLKNLKKLQVLFEEIADRVHKVAEPAKRFVESVLNRELAAASSATKMDWDARELVFAAAAYGAATRWNSSERLTRACVLLSKAISQSGTFPTGRPFLFLSNGFILHPIAFEVTRCFATLMQHVDVPIKPKLVQRLLYLFREHRCELGQVGLAGKCGWCFEDPLLPTRPSLWVTAIAVMALNRIVRMLNEKINSAVFKNFSVKIPGKNLTGLKLQELIYPDYGLKLAPEKIKDDAEWRNSIAIFLEQMRAHILRTKLPKVYDEARYSALFYGPPGTGKTTFLEALAFSSDVPLVEISPSDIVVAGQELVESRARAVFEALSMLSRVVIILDEFEPVLRKRDMATGETSIFTFVTPAMLPKLKKLHDAAKQQSIAYCLVTNRVADLDEAATRKGRFDHRVGIYNMDPLSRAGAFLNKIFANVEKLSVGQYGRFEEVIKLLAVVPIEEAVKEWFQVPAKNKALNPETAYAYILENSENFRKGLSYRKALSAYDRSFLNEDQSFDPMKKWLDELELKLKDKSLEGVLSSL